jgi:hypothetical protein
MYKDNIEMLEDMLLLAPPLPECTDYEMVIYFVTVMIYPGVDLLDYADSFVAIYGKRSGKGETPAEAIRNCLFSTN